MYIQVLIFYDIQDGICSYRLGVYGFFSICLFIDSGILPLLLMLIVGYRTIKNIQQSKRAARPLAPVNRVRSAEFTGISRKDLHFTTMLFNQILL
ncbi:unnamed protein product [Rotaria socialis]|uniref:Uncharacterized protein n=1 Tax=Rotaria socialis TaxID=392032 RepID=A0A818C6U7_9BILA|nr:unnamed protein product [Rotaria socialis]CAF3385559.1 unnamed protein product [Rotaria socialis]CAF3424372.1 unnamed protein product [Rotaria socialis]CAF3692590.1 unnamed protein product [Rotaria socialis]CAF4273979.1 unnamed protein product [Rotaria socialis]